MNLAQKKQEIKDRYRKEQHHNLFRKIRKVLLEQNATRLNEDEKFSSGLQGQRQIIELIDLKHKGQTEMSFIGVNDYILSCQVAFTEEFKEIVAKTVLEEFRTDGHAIASLAHLAFNVQDQLFLKKINNLREILKALVEENLSQDNKIKNGRAIAFLLFNLLVKAENKEDFYFLPKYYGPFANSIGYFDQAFILMLEAASHSRYLQPQEAFIKDLLSQERNFSQLEPLTLQNLCQMLQNYVCYLLPGDVYVYLSKWIQKRLKQSKFPHSLKKTLLKIMSIALSYEHIAAILDSQDSNIQMFKEIGNIAKFGSSENRIKEQALICLAKLASKCSIKRLLYFIQNIQLLEILVYSLELKLQQDSDTFKILQSIYRILEGSHQYRMMAQNYGLMSYLYRLSQSKTVVVAEMATIIGKLYVQ